MQDSAPMILFVGQVGTDQRQREAFQEIDYRAFFSPIAKWVTEIEHVDRIPETVSRAYTTALSGRPGPVVVALPENVLVATSMMSPGSAVRVPEAGPTGNDLDEACRLIDGAERPLVIVGGGGWNEHGKTALQGFAEANHLPVVVGFRRHDTIDNTSPSYIGEAGVAMPPHVRRAISESDVVLAVGTRFGEMATGAYTLFDLPDPRQTVIHAHSSDRELGKVIQADLPIHAGPNQMMLALAERRLANSDSWNGWTQRSRAAHTSALIAPPQPGALDMAEVMLWLQESLPADVVITNGAGNFTVWPNKHFSFGRDARLLAPQSGSMGYGLPAAVAAKLAFPDRLVVCFAGDGDVQMNIQELGTAMQEGAQPIVLVLNNNMYGTIRMHQERSYPARLSGTSIVNPDYVSLGHAYGFHAERVTETSEFAEAFRRAAASESGALLELITPPEMLTPTLSIDDVRSVETS